MPLALWRAQREALLARAGRLGVWLAGDDDPADDRATTSRIFGVVAVRLPEVHRRPRLLASARLLRERYGWQGELRAIGDVLRDQLFYLTRCGFDAFALRDGEDLDDALAGVRRFQRALPGFGRAPAAALPPARSVARHGA